MSGPHRPKPELLYKGLFEKLGDFMERADAAPPPSWLLEGLVPSTGSIEIVAEPNAGKTYFALILAKRALEAKRSVFLVEEEGPLWALGNRLRSLGIRPGPGQFLYVAHRMRVLLADASALDALRQCMADTEAPVMILDSFSSVTSGNENDSEDAQRIIQQFDTLISANPRALLVVLHHTSKAGGRGEGSALYAARGSSKFQGWFDAQLNLRRLPVLRGSGQIAFRLENPKQREDEQAVPKRVTITLGTGGIEMADDEEASGRSAEAIDYGRRILDFLAANTDLVMSADALAAKVKGKTTHVKAAIKQLELAGAIRNDPGRGYAVVPVPVVPGRSGTDRSRVPPPIGERIAGNDA